MTNPQQSSDAANWKRKGLGWVPDYPDRRDYTLKSGEIQQQGRLRREEGTGSIESLAGTLLAILRQNADQGEEFKHAAELLEQKIFGGIGFENVKLYKILRKGISSDDVLKLKSYLSILGYTGCLLEKEEGSNCKFKTIDFYKRPQEWLSTWLNSRLFDDDTEQLVQGFQTYYNQHFAGISGTSMAVDGIVGLDTYDALCKTFSFLGKSREDIAKELQTPVSNTLVSIPSLIPVSLFRIVLKKIKDFAVQQICLEKDAPDAVFERQLVAGNLFEIEIFNHLGSKFHSQIDKTEITELLEKDIEQNKLVGEDESLSEEFVDIVNQRFSLLDPIISLVVQIIYPLGNSKNLEGSVEMGLRMIDILLAPEQSSGEKINIPLYEQFRYTLDSHSLDSEYLKVQASNLRQLVAKAIQKASDIFHNEGINLVLMERKLLERKKAAKERLGQPGEEHSYQDEELMALRRELSFSSLDSFRLFLADFEYEVEKAKNNSTLCFYFLIKKFINHYLKQSERIVLSIGQTSVKSLPLNMNEFSKRELFEITQLLPDRDENESEESGLRSTGSPLDKVSLFIPTELAIPINKDFRNTVTWTEMAGKKARLYFFLPGVVDLSLWCPAVEDQGMVNSCAAFAGVTLLEYFAKRSRGKYTDVSPLFLYKASRNLMNVTGDVGASIRATMKAIALFGVPPDEYWPYDTRRIEEEPPSFCYSFAQNYQALKYFRLDYAGISNEILLSQIKAVLAAGFPCMFGFTIYTSAYDEDNIRRGLIPVPGAHDRVVGGHAVVAVGYSDYEGIRYADGSAPETLGALFIRNSWGMDWGKGGYGWLPYDYILKGLTGDWWSMLKSEWFEDDAFGLGSHSPGTRYPLTYP